jgi:hypothetical protein
MSQKVENAGRKMPGNGYVVGEICQTENPFPFHPKSDCEHEILKERRSVREEITTLINIKFQIV